MCRPTETNPAERRRILIAGAGPAGLLTASLILAKNDEIERSGCGGTIYHVTLVDGRQDFGRISKEELSKSFRSWMLGLATHGLDAIRKLPRLYEDYVKGEGILVEEFNIYLGKRRVNFSANDLPAGADVPEGFIVDRNHIVAAIARYLKDQHEDDDNFTAMYRTTCQYVDYEQKQVLVRRKNDPSSNAEKEEEFYVPYDLLVGCDGVRSTVREALIKRHSDFSCEVTDIFQEFKATHLQLPLGVSDSSLHVLPDIFPGFQGIGLPEKGNMINVTMGVPRNRFDDIPTELKSDDYSVVSKYARENFKAFELVDYDDFGRQWVGQRWNQTGMVHCNFYHSLEAGVVIMGDAAHATSPSIGMGMNTALRDAQILCELLLEEHKGDLSKVLPAFSEARVREGNSLSDLALHLYCMDKGQQMRETIHQVVRSALHLRFPKLVQNHPQSIIGMRGVALSDVYDLSTRLGIISRHREINDRVRREYFESRTGMVKKNEKGAGRTMFLGAAAIAVGAMALNKWLGAAA